MLKKYLQHIKEGKAVHYSKLLQLLPPGFYQRRSELFKVKVTGAGKWQVTVLDQALFEQLWQSALAPQDRQTASLQGNSHQAVTSYCYLLLYHNALPDVRPDLVLASTEQNGAVCVTQAYQPKTKLLLIENEENFFCYPKVLQLATQMLAQPFRLDNCDVALAAGSRIGSALLTDWLMQYQEIYCAFDFDAAGLEVFDSLKKKYGDKVQFVAAPDLTPWLSGFKCLPKQQSHLDKAIQLAAKHRLFGLEAAFSQTKHFLEQEVLLAGV